MDRIENNFKRLFIAGFNSGKQALSEGNNDLSVEFYYESFIEQHGLPHIEQCDEHLKVLRELMFRFDNEAWNCPKCGHGEDTKTMDSASYLREYLDKCVY